MTIKRQQKKTTINREEIQEEDHILFSFKHLTNNRKYGLDPVNNMGLRDGNEAYKALLDKFTTLSQMNYSGIFGIGKRQGGCDPIPYTSFGMQMKSIMDNIDLIKKDSVLSVFYFGGRKYRLICKQDIQNRNLLYVIGFDWDFTAYNH